MEEDQEYDPVKQANRSVVARLPQGGPKQPIARIGEAVGVHWTQQVRMPT